MRARARYLVLSFALSACAGVTPSTAVPSPTLGQEPSGTPSPPTPILLSAETFAIPFRMTWDVPIRSNVKTDVVDVFFGQGGMNLFDVEQVGTDPCHFDELAKAPLQTGEEFMAWLATIPRVTAGPVTPTTFGGRPAVERTVTAGKLDGCIDTGALHSGIVSQYGDGADGYFIGAGEHERLIALQVDGELMAVVTYPDDEPALAATAGRALTTLEFLP
jgi:hypothetical protein